MSGLAFEMSARRLQAAHSAERSDYLCNLILLRPSPALFFYSVTPPTSPPARPPLGAVAHQTCEVNFVLASWNVDRLETSVLGRRMIMISRADREVPPPVGSVDSIDNLSPQGLALHGCGFHLVARGKDLIFSDATDSEGELACLNWALNALGARVPTNMKGLFRALEHGNAWLAELGLELIRQPCGPSGPGGYVKWGPPRGGGAHGHFTAVVVYAEGVVVMNRERGRFVSTEYNSIDDIPGVRRHKWFLLQTLALVAESTDPLGGANASEPSVSLAVGCKDPPGGMEGAEAGDTISQQLGALLPGDIGEMDGPQAEAGEAAEGRAGELPGGHGEESEPPRKQRKIIVIDVENLVTTCQARGATSAAALHKDAIVNKYSTLAKTNALRELVKGSEGLEAYGEDIMALAVGALAVYRWRSWDIGLREHVLVFNVITGDKLARARTGVFYSYDDGAWRAYSGVPQEVLLGACREYLKQLERFFSLYARKPRFAKNDRELIEDGVELIADLNVNSDQERLHALEDAAGKDSSEDEKKAADDIANNIRKLSSDMQRELLQGSSKSILAHFCEWCSTPQKAAHGFCLPDACLLEDEEGKMKPVNKSPSNNVYLRVDAPLTDPVEQHVTDRVFRFYTQTFWNNGPALQCQLAAMSLALRGYNIDRCFWTIGPGGVGQSLFSHHINATFAPLRAFIDTNAYYSDDELRKQAELLVGKCITTAQEAVEGSMNKMREDLYKKHISADPNAGRLPYGIVTKLLSLPGWNRIELNKLLRFRGVTAASFNRLFRRSWVRQFLAQFLDLEDLQQIPNAADRGCFLKDSDLKEFLQSAPAVGSAWKMVWGFMEDHNQKACVKTIDDYANGGDGGLTKSTMLVATGVRQEDLICAGTRKDESANPEERRRMDISASLALAAFQHDAETISESAATKAGGGARTFCLAGTWMNEKRCSRSS